EDSAVAQRLPQQTVIAGAGDLDRAELRQMRRQKLRVEQTVAAVAQARHEMHERDLARIGDAAEHALAKKGAAERDAVKTADQFTVMPALDAVRGAPLEVAGCELQVHVTTYWVGKFCAQSGLTIHV